jgi:hypothetical protein
MVVPAPRAERKPADQSRKADRHLTRRTQENFEHLWGSGAITCGSSAAIAAVSCSRHGQPLR